MEITGQIVAIGDIQQGQSARGAWTKQTIVIETIDQYPKKIACLLFNDMVDKAQALNLGDTVTFVTDIESREFNGRWYTDVKAWSIKGAAQGAPAQIPNPPLPPLPPMTGTQGEFNINESGADDDLLL